MPENPSSLKSQDKFDTQRLFKINIISKIFLFVKLLLPHGISSSAICFSSLCVKYTTKNIE